MEKKQLPKGWEWKKLGEVTEILMGQSPSSSTYSEKKEDMPFYQGKTEFGERFPTVRKYCSKPIKIAEANDILMSVRAPVGPVNICERKSCIGRGLCAIRANSNLNYLFLYHFLKANEKDISARGTGSTFAAINKRDIENIQIPIAPLKIQEKVIEILEQAEKLKQRRQISNNKTNEILQSIFFEMFGDPIINDKKWKIAKWNNSVEIINGRSQKEVVNKNGKYPIYGSGGVMGFADKFLSPENSVIIGRKGSINNPIKVKTKFWNVDTAFSLVPKKDFINCDYLFNFCLLYNFERLNTSTTLPSLTKTNLLQIEMPIPPIELQNKFTERVEIFEKIKENQEILTNEIDDLYDVLIQKSFNGELVK